MRLRKFGMMVTAIVSSVVGLTAPSTAHAAPSSIGRDCVVRADDKAATVDVLLNRCTSQQIMSLFLSAPLGEAPKGTLSIALLPVFQVNGKAVADDAARAGSRTQNLLGKTLTFTTGANGGPWVYKDYLWGRDAGGALVRTISRIDRKPVYAADFRADFGGVPISLHEYRQLTPGVWIGRDIGGRSSAKSAGPTGGAFALS